MPLLATLDEAAYNALPDKTTIGKDAFVKNEKENNFWLDMSGEEAGKLALPLQEKVKKLSDNNKELLDEKVKVLTRLTPFEKLGRSAEEIEKALNENKAEGVAEIESKYKAEISRIASESEGKLKTMQDDLAAAVKSAEELRGELWESAKKSAIDKVRADYNMGALGEDYLANRVRVVPDEADPKKPAIRVFENGQVAYKGGTFKTLEQLAEEARANRELSGMFIGGKAGGTGGEGNQRQPAGNGSVSSDDSDAIAANIAEIAAGKIQVV
ncbi:MAG: hypothetical protein AB7P97_21575 [Hyphomonadaceae bacterium]